MKSEYEKYIVAHIDVLGTKDILKNCKSSNEFLLKLRDIHSAARSEIGNFNKSVQNEFDQQKDGFECKDFNVKTKIFSDNICIYLKYPESNLYSMYITWFMRLIAYFQYYSLFEHRLLVRGAVNIENFYEDDIFIAGLALSTAYEYEAKYAIVPRILICDEFKSDFFAKEKREGIPFTRKDFDGRFFVDYLIYTNRKDKTPKDQLTEHRDILIEKFKEAKEYEHKLKVLLAMIYHNRYCNNINEWDLTHKTGKSIANLRQLGDCSIDITEFLMDNSL